MCGIFGGISLVNPEETLRRMGQVLRHRGPDEQGAYCAGPVALGHQRLSIIDLAGGQQPMFSPDRQQVLVFNGEIYNFKDIRKELALHGHVFRTASDTEVILSAYRQWGRDCLPRFHGMFAFALWDNALQQLWLVRDRLGKKPLYIMPQGRSFYFASEAKALWAVPGFQGEMDPRAVDQYLTFRYVPGKRTFYRQIKKVPAGHWLAVNADGTVAEERQWWDLYSQRETARPGKGPAEYAQEFQEIFSSAVRERLIADVPLGLFLSSGIDSVSIATEMAKVSRPTLITIGFGDEKDETAVAAAVAKELGGTHHVLTMEEKDFSALPDVVAAMDEPYGDPIILPTYFLAQKAAQSVKVILTGDGADEILGGYVHQTFFRRMPETLPEWVRRAGAAAAPFIPVKVWDVFFQYPASMGAAGKKRLSALLTDYNDSRTAYLNWAALFSAQDRQALYTDDFRRALAQEPDEFDEDMRRHFARRDIGLFDKVLQWDLRTWFSEQTLMKLDRLSMAHSIEGRCPYADHRLVEFFLRMPFSIYKTLADNKGVVRRLYQPRKVPVVKKKQPFFLPMHRGFDARLRNFQEEVLASVKTDSRSWFRFDAVARFQEERASSPLIRDKQIMSLAILQQWLRSRTPA